MTNFIGVSENEKQMIDNVDVVSFDCFDTILLRCVKNPAEVFIKMALKMQFKGILSELLSPEDFLNIRLASADNCHHNSEGECCLEDIYNVFPRFAVSDVSVDQLVELEVETEKEVTFLNPDIYRLMQDLHISGKRLYITSDMYLSKNQISDLLSNAGFDLNLVEDIIVSSEYGVSKLNEGRLYDHLIGNSSVDASRIVHIGDNYISDYYWAKAKGLKAIHYATTIEEPKEKVLEKWSNSSISSMESIVKLLSHRMCLEENKDFWYRQGAIIWGPVLSLFAEWLIDMAEKNNIHNIFPLMREGYLISQLVNKIIEIRHLELVCKPMYVSRYTLVLPGYTKMNRKVLAFYLKCPGQRVGDTIDAILGSGVYHGKFDKYRDLYMPQLINMGLQEALYEELTKEEYQKAFCSMSDKQRESFINYLDDNFDWRDGFITADIGFSGTFAAAIDRIIKEINVPVRTMHGLLSTNSSTRVFLNEGSKIIGFAKNYIDENDWGLYSSFTEGLFMGDEGTTLGYKKKDSKMVPVCGKSLVNRKIVRNRELFQEGVLSFLDLYLKCSENKRITYDRLELSKPLDRLFNFPTKEEAKNYLDQDYENDKDNVISYSTYVDRWKQDVDMSDSDYAQILMKYLNGCIWPQAVISLFSESETLKHCLSDNDDINIRIAQYLCVLLQNKDVREVIIYGAGRIGTLVYQMLRFYNIEIVYIVDKDERKHGQPICDGGSTICSVDVLKSVGRIPIVIATMLYCGEIKKAIQDMNPTADIYCMEPNKQV